MILTREILIRITISNIGYYENLGYDVYLGEDLHIPVDLLSKNSHFMIRCKCDGDDCNIEKDIMFKNYIRYNNEWGKYYCRKCSEFKRKESLIKSYGVEYPYQSKDLRNFKN